MPLTLDGTNGITQSASFKSNTYLDAAGGNTATVNGTLIPASGVTLVSTAANQTLTNKSIAGSQLTGTVASSLLTGALPAIDGSALTGIVTGGMTLLGTLTTTSGTSQTLSSLTLTSYKYVLIDYYNIGATTTGYVYVKGNAGANAIITANANQPSGLFGKAVINLSNSFVIFDSIAGAIGSVSGGAVGTGETSVSTSTTSLVFSLSGAGTFNKGVVTIYGVK